MNITRKTITHSIEDPEQDVTIDITMGDAQDTGVLTLISKGRRYTGSEIKENLGKGADLKGTTSRLTGPVTNTNPATSFVSVNVALTNGQQSDSASGKTTKEASTVTFNIQIEHQ